MGPWSFIPKYKLSSSAIDLFSPQGGLKNDSWSSGCLCPSPDIYSNKNASVLMK